MMDVSVCIQQTQYRVESALYIFVSEISVNNSCVKCLTPALSMKYFIFPFRKGLLSFNTVDATMGNQALVMIDVILYTLVFPGSSYKKANTFLNSFRDNDVAARV